MTQQAYTGHTGPYIVTTKRPCTTTADSCHGDPEIEACICGGRVSRRAVATLEEARGECCSIVTASGAIQTEVYLAAEDLPEAGGTVGPLPDGTVITVEATTWTELARGAGVSSEAIWEMLGTMGGRPEVELIAAFNAAQAEG